MKRSKKVDLAFRGTTLNVTNLTESTVKFLKSSFELKKTITIELSDHELVIDMAEVLFMKIENPSD
jgi:hypothetical protein